MAVETEPLTLRHKVRVVTAASLFDGHDASINIMRRVLQATGAEVVHLGHNHSVWNVVNAAIQEDAQAIAMTSYQGGHVEYFKYMYDLLRERGAGHIRIFGGGGGTILPTEIEELHAYGITRIYSPDDGRSLGLQGMINDLLRASDYPVWQDFAPEPARVHRSDHPYLARCISVLENTPSAAVPLFAALKATASPEGGSRPPVLGITGSGGAGKSSLTDELVRRFLLDFPDKHIAILSVDPSKRKTGGALLGDRIRMNAIHTERVFMRSFATRAANTAVSGAVTEAIRLLQHAGYDLIIVETAGIGQSDSQITQLADVSLYVMTPEYGAATQLEKIDMLDFADLIALNKCDKRGAADALRDVQKQVQRNHKRFGEPLEHMPVYGTMAAQFNDPGTHRLYRAVMDTLVRKTGAPLASNFEVTDEMSQKIYIIPPDRTRYLAEIAEESDRYNLRTEQQVALARKLYRLRGAIDHLRAALNSSNPNTTP
jgi:methylmalonyl-CoA mutase